MKVHYGINDLQKPDYAVVTSGTFDGVHLGHQKILNRLKEICRQNPLAQSVVLTFHPHPRTVVSDQYALQLLSTLDEKIEKLANLGIDHLVVIPFNKEFSQQSSEEFVQNVLVNALNTKKLVIGYDHRFGKNREGSFEHLKENEKKYGFEVEEIPQQDLENVAVSSTKIRNALQNGNILLANQFLASPYTLTGEVVKGDQIGRKIGFPTANLKVSDPYKLIPVDGVYAVKVRIQDKKYLGMLYIGKRSTIGENLAKVIETNIFDFEQDIYGKTITLELIQQIRADQKFENLQAIQIQLALDKKKSLKILKR
ncbi:MAG: bifunctional riboflavin kinase/FAD synthetase [Bacteroidetes bacterium]|nr:MAG: bifunctional riboflavin kinase/FAD synthetase [Bacteroidota bacterium]